MEQKDDWHLTEALEHEDGRGDPFAAAVRATRMAMIITDPAKPDNPIVFVNEAFQKLTGYDRSEIIGRNCRFLQGPQTDRRKVDQIRDAIAAGEDIALDILNYRKDGTSFWNALYLSPVRGEKGDIQYFFASQIDVTDRVEAQARIAEQKSLVEREVAERTADLQASLEEKTLLLHEVDHRVKNNLTMIGSLIRLQTRQIGDEQVVAKLNNMLERVDALATVHRRLYQTEDIRRFDVGGFTSNLVSDVVAITGRGDVEVHSACDTIEVPSAIAAPLGLMINEIVTNALKHAFNGDGGGGRLSVRARRENGTGVVEIADNGPGIDPEAGLAGGLGHTIINRLARQAGATIEWQNVNAGTKVVVTFPADR